MPNTKFVVLINPKSGGNVGAELLSNFHGILDYTKVYNLQEGGPKKALEDHCIKKYVLGVHRVGTMKITNEFQPHTAYKHQGFRSGLI